MKHCIYLNTKGGSGKSTLAYYSANELQRLGYPTEVVNLDQQQHIIEREDSDAAFCIYDTPGVFASDTLDLLNAARDANSVIIIPTGCGVNDTKEIPFVADQLAELGLIDRCTFVFTRARPNSKALRERRQWLESQGHNVARWFMPLLEDFSEQRDTSRTRNEISAFIHEVIL
ncbi:ParA family protein [Vibrio parahaemolyticus]|nr:ParA family protein [Vibrio parahaemolyticus]